MNVLLERSFGIRLLDPWMLLALLALPAFHWWRIARGAPSILFAPAVLLEGLSGWRERAALLPRGISTLGVACAVLALARPVEREELPLVTEGIDVFLVLDVSSSMSARDLDPEQGRDRLEVAKAAAARFIAGRPDDRIGLITFAAFPEVRCPLTFDHAALGNLLQETEMVSEASPENGTGIGLATARAAQLLERSAAKSKVIVLLTDGKETVATREAPPVEIRPYEAAQLARELGIRTYTIAAGIGERSAAGWVALDRSDVEYIARETGGRFFEAQDARALDAVYAEIDALEKGELREPRFRYEERFVPVLALGLVLLLLAWALEGTLLQELP